MGHEKLVKALEAETEQEAEKIVADAKKQANDLLQNAEADAEKLKQHKLNAVVLEIEKENTSKKNALASSLKGDLNSLKYSLIERVLDEIFLELKNLPAEKYRAALTKLFDDLLHHIYAYDKGSIYADSDADTILQSYAKSKKIDLQKGDLSDDIKSGFLFISNDKKIKAESSFGSVIEAIKPQLVIELKELLFGEL